MPLNTPKLYADIKKILVAQKTNTGNQDLAIDTLAKDLSIAIDDFVRSGLVITHTGQAITIAPGTSVATTGTQYAQTGTTVSPGIGLSSAEGTGEIV